MPRYFNNNTGQWEGDMPLSGMQDWTGQYPTDLNANDADAVANFNQNTRAPGTISVRMPDGSVQYFDQINEQLNQAIRAGGQPLGQDGQPLNVAQIAQGWTGGGQPLNQLFGMGLMPGQQQVLDTQTQVPYAAQQGGTPPSAQSTLPSDFWASLGINDLPGVSPINLGQMPTMSDQFSPQFTQDYWNRINDQQGYISGLWDQSRFPTMEAAQMDLAGIPQPNAQQAQASLIGNVPQGDAAQMNLGNIPSVEAAQVGGLAPAATSQAGIPTFNADTPESFEALQFLLSGQGFAPDVLAKMRANATDANANQGIANLSAGRLAAERAGLGSSGMNVALASQIGRDNAARETQSMNAIDIQNALQGMQNMTTGAGMESARQALAAQLGTSANAQNAANQLQGNEFNASQANQMGQFNNSNELQRLLAQAGFGQQANLANAQMQFGGQQINAGNQQQMNLANLGNQMSAASQNSQLGTQANLTNAQQANLMALQNAQNILQGMQQNTANMQQTNQTNFAGDTARATNQAQNTGNIVQQGSNTFNQGQVSNAANANASNANAAQNWMLNQANLNRQADLSNVDWGRNNYTNSLNALVSLNNNANPAIPSNNATQAINLQQPTNWGASLLAGLAQGFNH